MCCCTFETQNSLTATLTVLEVRNMLSYSEGRQDQCNTALDKDLPHLPFKGFQYPMNDSEAIISF